MVCVIKGDAGQSINFNNFAYSLVLLNNHQMISFRQLNAFVQVAQHQSFQRAADVLNLTSAAISLTIKQLEAESGQSLFDRSTRRVSLTPAGQEFLPYAQAALQGVSDAARALEHVGESRLVIACAPSVARRLLPTVIAQLHAQSPQLQIEIREGTAVQVFDWVQDQSADVGVQGDLPGYPSLSRRLAVTDPFVRVGSGERIGLTEDTAIERALAASGWDAPAIRASTPEAAIALREEIGGLLVLPQLTLPPGSYVRLRGLNRRLMLIQRAHGFSKAAQRLAEIMLPEERNPQV